MKKFLIVLTCIAVIFIGGFAWWRMPVRFLKNIESENISRIEVFNGSTGIRFTVTDQKDIKYIVENISQKTMRKSGISLSFTGTRYNMKFISPDEEVIDSFIINSKNTIRKDPFFYFDETESLCSEYLRELEKKTSK